MIEHSYGRNDATPMRTSLGIIQKRISVSGFNSKLCELYSSCLGNKYVKYIVVLVHDYKGVSYMISNYSNLVPSQLLHLLPLGLPLSSQYMRLSK